jgi:hypothetical protein
MSTVKSTSTQFPFVSRCKIHKRRNQGEVDDFSSTIAHLLTTKPNSQFKFPCGAVFRIQTADEKMCPAMKYDGDNATCSM